MSEARFCIVSWKLNLIWSLMKRWNKRLSFRKPNWTLGGWLCCLRYNIHKKKQTKLRSSIFWVKCAPKNYLHLLLLLTEKCRDQHAAAAYRTPMIAKKEHVQWNYNGFIRNVWETVSGVLQRSSQEHVTCQPSLHFTSYYYCISSMLSILRGQLVHEEALGHQNCFFWFILTL